LTTRIMQLLNPMSDPKVGAENKPFQNVPSVVDAEQKAGDARV